MASHTVSLEFVHAVETEYPSEHSEHSEKILSELEVAGVEI